MNTSAPSSANRLADDRPLALLPPVMIAILFLSLLGNLSDLLVVDNDRP
jgi:hypothetical protein